MDECCHSQWNKCIKSQPSLSSALTHLLLVVFPIAAQLTSSGLGPTAHGHYDHEEHGNSDGEEGARGQGGNRQNG